MFIRGVINLNKIKIVKKEDSITFEDIKHIDLSGNEYWEARELMPYSNIANGKIFIK